VLPGVIHLSAVGVSIRISCPAGPPELAECFGGLAAEPSNRIDVEYGVERRSGSAWVLEDGSGSQRCEDLGALLLTLEDRIVIDLQRRRPNLIFFHAAALEAAGRAVLLIGASGAGKSTLSWMLLQRGGFGYLSDELAPVSPADGAVHAYTHALCLKTAPPGLPLPPGTLTTGTSFHVPAERLPASRWPPPVPLGSLVFLTGRDPALTPRLRCISSGEATARLYAAALNALAHPEQGLEVAERLAKRAPAYCLVAGELQATAEMLAANFAGG